ncbi:MAG: hypothetical protein VX370_03080 [Bacteroidota bacterium]|nr:hypothetical protein [Bacteroidota bacterium]
MNNFNDLKAPLTWALGIVFIVCIFMLNANTIRENTAVGGDAWNTTSNMQEWHFDNALSGFEALFVGSNNIIENAMLKKSTFNFTGSITNNTNFNFGTPSSTDILFFEDEEAIDIEALIEEIIAEMDSEDDSTATSPSEE